MDTAAQGLAPDTPPPAAPNEVERLLTFLREENSANRETLREESKSNREMLLGTIRIVALPVTAAIVLIGWFGLRSFSDLKGQLRDTATAQVKAEVPRMQEEIRERLNQQFQTPTLKATVNLAAREATQTAAAPLIREAVTREVQSHIRAEQPAIRASVVEETKNAVAAMQPSVDAEIGKQTAAAQGKIEAQIAPYDQVIKASTLAALARGGDANALDRLLSMGNSANPDVRQLAVTTYNAIWLQYEEVNGFTYLSRTFSPPKKQDELLQMLKNADPLARKAAIDDLTNLGDKAVVPELIDIMRHDPLFIVRQAALHGLVRLTGQNFNPLGSDAWEQWWAKNKDNWPPKQPK